MGYKFDILKMLLKRTSSVFKKQIKTTNVNQKKVTYAQIGNQTPAVVFENGFGVNMKIWDEVFLEISKTNSVFAYNRQDNRVLKDKIMPSDMVENLRVILKDRELKPPYILVGHSIGGLNAQYFARKHPEEVSGVVLVDTSHPKDFEDTSLIPKSQVKTFAHLDACGQEVLDLQNMQDIPLITLAATYKNNIHKYPKKMIPHIEATEKRMETFPELYPNCELRWIDSGHFIMYEKPRVVSESIKEVIKKIRIKDTHVQEKTK